MKWTEGDRVEFNSDSGRLTGVIVRVWSKPVADPYVTIHTDDNGRTFVRCSSAVTEA